MLRKLTIGEHAWPNTPEFNSIANTWSKNASTKILSFVWQGFQLLERNLLSNINFTKDDTEDIERSITKYLEPSIRKVMTGFEPFYVQHGTYEDESRFGGKAQPPQYDIAFCLNDYPTSMWPLEAKLLRTDGSIADYIADIKEQFLTCRYAPFSSEGAMLGYLISGSVNKVFENIAKNLGCALTDNQDFPDYDQKFSDHQRIVPSDKTYPINFRCHHLIFDIKSKMQRTINNPQN